MIRIDGVSKFYRLGAIEVPALQDVSLTVEEASFTVIAGPSGSGKTSLLNVMGCLDRPDRGSVHIAGQAVAGLSENKLSDFRLRHLGFVFQNFNLLSALTAAENVEYPLVLTKRPRREREPLVKAMLEAVGLGGKGRHRPNELSGGERQRVAIARALIAGPQVVLADEPTANLDSRTGAEIIALMRGLQRERGTTFVFSSHDPQLIGSADSVIRLKDGAVQGDWAQGEAAQ